MLGNIRDFAFLKTLHWLTAQAIWSNFYLIKKIRMKEKDLNQLGRRNTLKKSTQMMIKMPALKYWIHLLQKKLKI